MNHLKRSQWPVFVLCAAMVTLARPAEAKQTLAKAVDAVECGELLRASPKLYMYRLLQEAFSNPVQDFSGRTFLLTVDPSDVKIVDVLWKETELTIHNIVTDYSLSTASLAAWAGTSEVTDQMRLKAAVSELSVMKWISEPRTRQIETRLQDILNEP